MLQRTEISPHLQVVCVCVRAVCVLQCDAAQCVAAQCVATECVAVKCAASKCVAVCYSALISRPTGKVCVCVCAHCMLYTVLQYVAAC